MIKKEFFSTRNDNSTLFKTFSTSGFKIQKAGTTEIYDEAIDVEYNDFEYFETTILIDGYSDKIQDGTIIEGGDQELTQEEIATMLEEVF